MKVQSLLLLTSAATLCSSVAFGFAEVGRGELTLSTTARETYDSRVLGGTDRSDDYIFTFEPRLMFRREAGQLKLDSFVGTRINRYADFTEFNSEDLEGSFRLSLPPGTTAGVSGSFVTTYDERNEVNYDVNRRIREKVFSTRLDTDIPLSLKTSLLLGGMYRHDERNQFSDRNSREGTAGFRYLNFLGGSAFDIRYRHLEVDTSGSNLWAIPINQSSDMVTGTFSRPLYGDVRGSVSYGYRWLRRSKAEVFGGDPNTDGSVLSLNLEGPFLPPRLFPKLDSSLSIGYEKAETPGINDRGGSRVIGSMHLGWNARERTQIFLEADRSRDLSVNDVTVLRTSANIGIRQGIGDFMNAHASIGTERRDYVSLGRKDDVMLVAAGLNYRMTKYWSADAEYRLRDANSTLPTADYSRHLVTVSATYTF